jgi:hypothetical protein
VNPRPSAFESTQDVRSSFILNVAGLDVDNKGKGMNPALLAGDRLPVCAISFVKNKGSIPKVPTNSLT